MAARKREFFTPGDNRFDLLCFACYFIYIVSVRACSRARCVRVCLFLFIFFLAFVRFAFWAIFSSDTRLESTSSRGWRNSRARRCEAGDDAFYVRVHSSPHPVCLSSIVLPTAQARMCGVCVFVGGTFLVLLLGHSSVWQLSKRMAATRAREEN